MDRLLRWILVFEMYDSEIEYIQCKKNIVADSLSILTNSWNQNTSHESNYITETRSEMYYID